MNLLIGFEKEFYLNKALGDADLKHVCDVLKMKSATLVQERGKNQYELVTKPHQYLMNFKSGTTALVDEILSIYNHQLSCLLEILSSYDVDFDDSAKPFADDYGSALQLNFSVLQFCEADYLAVIYCILERAKQFQVDVNSSTGYQRFVQGFMAPTHICWGGNNNRTTLIRMMNLKYASDANATKTRVEYRGVNSDADPAELLNFIIKSVYQVYEMKALDQIDSWNLKLGKKYQKIWGNAHDAQYHLECIESRVALY